MGTVCAQRKETDLVDMRMCSHTIIFVGATKLLQLSMILFTAWAGVIMRTIS